MRIDLNLVEWRETLIGNVLMKQGNIMINGGIICFFMIIEGDFKNKKVVINGRQSQR